VGGGGGSRGGAGVAEGFLGLALRLCGSAGLSGLSGSGVGGASRGGAGLAEGLLGFGPASLRGGLGG